MSDFTKQLHKVENANPFVVEQASAGATSSANVASVAAPFGLNDEFWRSFYPPPKDADKKGKRSVMLRRQPATN